MCGICGIARPAGSPIDERELLRMRDALTHRGPDSAGHYIHENIGLGHRRLKIIDLSDAAAQPMANEDGSVMVVFNGELYNHEALRPELEAKGHIFRSRSDTEVIVHGYEEWGDRCVERLNGMFAIAVYDRRRRELFLARDHLGIKPLYYHQNPNGFLFASETKAFRGVAGFQPVLNEPALAEYLLYRSLARDHTLHGGVMALLPGHWLRLKHDLSVETKCYWDVDLSRPPLAGRFAEHEERVVALLEESVAMQEMSDVPIGAQLSGGTDSSLVTALMAARASRPVMTYAVGFEEVAYSELPYARRVALHLGTDHHEITLTNQEFADAFDRLSWQSDEPLTHSNGAGVYWLCREAKPSVTVLLTGEGADELFAGYSRYESLRKSVLAQRWLSPLAPLLPLAPDTRATRMLRRSLGTPVPQLIVRATAVGGDALAKHLDPSVRRRVFSEREAQLDPARGRGWLTQSLYYDLKTYLPPILMRQDRMSMAHGVETRVPFLDHRLVQLAFEIPTASKLEDGRGKRVIKSIASRHIPREVIYRPKVGFGFPLEPWMRSKDGLGARLDELTDTSSLARQLLPRPELAEMLADHRSGKATHTDALWTLMALESWNRTLQSPDATAHTPQLLAMHARPKVKKTTTVAHVVLGLQVGGLERVVVNLVKGLRDSRYRFVVCCLEERGEFADEVEKMGSPVFVIGKRPGIDWRASARLAQLFRREDVAIVHTHNTAAHLSGLMAAMLAGKRVLVHTKHGRNYPGDRRKVLLNRMLSWGTDAIVPVSEDACEVVREVEHVDPGRIQVILNGVDTEVYHPSGDAATRPPVIGTVARLSPEKDQLSMLAAFCIVRQSIPEAKLVIAGAGSSEQELREAAAALGIANSVDFLGVCQNVPEVLRTFSLFTLTSTTEGLSMTILEAMAAGLPVVATDVGGNRQIVNPPECGVVVPASDPKSLAAAYLDLLGDPERRARMSAAARARVVTEFGLDRMVRAYGLLYDELTARRTGDRPRRQAAHWQNR